MPSNHGRCCASVFILTYAISARGLLSSELAGDLKEFFVHIGWLRITFRAIQHAFRLSQQNGRWRKNGWCYDWKAARQKSECRKKSELRSQNAEVRIRHE